MNTQPHPQRAEHTPPWRFRIFIDGGCPLCAREATLMEKLDKGRKQGSPNLDIIDIAKPDFDPAQFTKDGRTLTHADFMATIHGQHPDGSVISGLDVFRQTYAAVGHAWVLNWTRLPVIRWFANKAYDLFAKHRLRLTGRKNACPTPPSTTAASSPSA